MYHGGTVASVVEGFVAPGAWGVGEDTDEEILRQDNNTLLIGGGRHHLSPYGRDLPVCGHTEYEAEVDPL